MGHIMVSQSLEKQGTHMPGGGTRPENYGGVPLAAENWTQKDRGKKNNLGAYNG